MESKTATGRHYEGLVAAHLEGKGYEIVARNVRFGPVELDLVAVKGRLLAFVEVKFRRFQRHFNPYAVVGKRKQQHIQRASLGFLQKNPSWRSHFCRYDVVLVRGEGDAVEFEHIEEAYRL